MLISFLSFRLNSEDVNMNRFLSKENAWGLSIVILEEFVFKNVSLKTFSHLQTRVMVKYNITDLLQIIISV